MAWGDLAGNGCFLGGASGHPAQLWLQSDKGRLFRQRIPFFDDDALHEDVEAHPNPDGNRDDIATTSCQIVPNRGRSCSSGAMPFIKEKFGTFHSFATASLAEIYPVPRL